VVGVGASRIDIAREISLVAKEVHVASRENKHRLGKIDLYPSVWMHVEVQKSELFFQANKHPVVKCLSGGLSSSLTD
jgi:cation diffusion facilitator CzcD-associated flavoprotein CzcO